MINLKYKRHFIYLLSFLLLACNSKDQDDLLQSVVLNFSFEHFWDDTPVTNADFNDFKFTTQAGDLISMERLRYLVSDVQIIDANNVGLEYDVYNLVDVTAGEGLGFQFQDDIPLGTYTVRLTFGLDNEDNTENYADLNSANFNVPEMLGGGYHYMQFDGKFINSESAEQGFNYHAIRAVDISGGSPVFPQDTFFTIDLGTIWIGPSTDISIRANLAEWFKNPNSWELNELNSVLMPNANAQILMYENGQSVFSLNN